MKQILSYLIWGTLLCVGVTSCTKRTTIVEPAVVTSSADTSLGYIFVSDYCTGDGTIGNPWVSADSSAGIKAALQALTPTKRVLYFRSGFYFTQGALKIDFSQDLPNLSNADWKTAFQRYGIEFLGSNANIYVNNGSALRGGKPGILFDWPGTDVFYWKFQGLGFLGNVDAAVAQWGIDENDFPLNGVDFDITGNNGYVPADYTKGVSPSSAITIYRPLDSHLNLVAVSATGDGVYLGQAAFCTISGAFSNSVIPGTNNIYPNSYAMKLTDCMSNNITSADLEVAYNGIWMDAYTFQNTFSALFVANCDSSGAVFNTSTQAAGKNEVISIRNGPTLNGGAVIQHIFAPASDTTKLSILNYFGG
ncbi:MAG TPA: hypothetical protein VGM30_14570 [Puia sp.]|jgi:hypothetical protein